MVRPPVLAKALLPGVTWRVKNSKNEVFVTFDDGPIPEITPWVLDEADKWNAKLTFFVLAIMFVKTLSYMLKSFEEGIGLETIHSTI